MHSAKNIKAAVIGHPIKHSLSPRLHGFWLNKYRLEGSYEAIEVKPENLQQILRDLPKKNFRGVNLTVPHKETALPIVDHVDDLARRVGAVNTIVVREDGTLEGRNTDVFGFGGNLRAGGYKPNNRPVTLLGAGGASRAALVALIDMGITDIRIMNRTLDRAEKLAQKFGADKIHAYKWDDPQAFDNISLLINATSLGLAGQPPLILNLDTLPCDAVVTDMVYAPLITDLLQRAQSRGNPIIDGLGMLLHQARPAFQAFFGVDPEVTPELRQHVLEGIA